MADNNKINSLNITVGTKVDLKGLNNLTTKLNNLKTPSDQKIKSITSFANSMKKLANSTKDVDGRHVNSLANSITKLSNVKFSKTLTKNFREFITTVNRANVGKFATQAKELNSALSPLARNLTKVASAMKELKGGKIEGAGALGRSLGKTARSYDKAMTEEIKPRTKKEKISEEGGEKTETKASLIGKAFALVTSKINQANEALNPFFNKIAVGEAYVQKLGEAMSPLLEKVAKIGSVIMVVVQAFKKLWNIAKKVAKVISSLGILNPFKGLTSTIKDAVTKLKGLFNSLKRIALYRALRTAIKEISKGFQEGIENLYHYSEAWGTDFAPALDKIATAMLYLKNSVASASAPIITYFAPAIDYATDRLVELLNVLNQFLAKITGRSNWTKAIKYPAKWADETSKATKKVKDNLQDFDELHILRTDNGGGGGDAEDYSKMFETVDLENDFAKWVDDFKKLIENKQFTEAGSLVASKVNDWFDSVNWETLGSNFAKKINNVFEFGYGFMKGIDWTGRGSDLATLLNGWIGSLNTELIGKTFASKWTAIVNYLYGFVSTFDFKKFGTKISQFVQGWFEEIDGAKIAKTFSKLIVGTFDIGISFLSNDKMIKEFSTDIVDFFNNLDIKGMVSQATRFIFNLASAIVTIVTDIFKGLKWGEIFSSVVDGINEGLNSAIYGTTTEGNGAVHTSRYDSNTTGVYVVGNQVIPIPGASSNSTGFSRRSTSTSSPSWKRDDGDLDPLLRTIANISDYINQDWGASIGDIHGKNKQVLADMFNLGKNSNKVTKNIVKDVKDLNKNVTESYKDTATTVNTRMTEMYDTTSKEHETISKNVSDSANNIKSSMTNAMTGVNDKTRSTTSNITSMFRTVTTSATADLTSMKNGAVSTYDSMAKAVTTPLNTLKTNTVNGFKSVKDGGIAQVNSLSSSVNNSFKTMNTNVKSTLDTAKKDWTDKFTGKGGIVSSLTDSASGITDGIKTAFSNAKSGAIDSVKSLKEGVAEHFNGVIGASEGMSSGVVTGMNKVIDSFKALHFKIPDWIPDKSLANKEWKMDISNVSKPGSFGRIDVKKLAKGGIVTSPTNALIGEAGREAVLPLERNTEWMDILSERIGGNNEEEMRLLREQNMYLAEIASKEFGISERAIFNAVRNENRNFTMRTGRSLLAT